MQKGGRLNPAPPSDRSQWDDTKIRAIIRDGDYHTLVDLAESVGRLLRDQKLSTSQLRNVFGEVRRLQGSYDRNRLIMLRPKLAYMAVRAGNGGKALRDLLTRALEEVFAGSPDEDSEKERFRRMADLFEAVLAYHRAFGGE
jgi:CRISPR-associated protein Csm2